MNKDDIVDVFKRYRSESISSIEEITSIVSKINTNNNKKYIIKKVKNDKLQIIKHEYKILYKLNQRGVPVAPILETKDGMYYVKKKEKYYFLFPFIDGKCIKSLYINDGQDIASSYGTSIAILHRGLKQISFNEDFSSDPFMNRILNASFDFISKYENQSKLSTIENIILECKSFESKHKELPIQLIHRDLHTENIIYSDNKVKAFIDFDNCSPGYRIYDLAYLMVDFLRQDPQATSNSYWLKLCKSLIKGYDKESPLLKSEYEAIWYCLLCSQFAMIGHFYRFKEIDKARKYLEGVFWIYRNKNNINKALLK